MLIFCPSSCMKEILYPVKINFLNDVNYIFPSVHSSVAFCSYDMCPGLGVRVRRKTVLAGMGVGVKWESDISP